MGATTSGRRHIPKMGRVGAYNGGSRPRSLGEARGVRQSLYERPTGEEGGYSRRRPHRLLAGPAIAESHRTISPIELLLAHGCRWGQGRGGAGGTGRDAEGDDGDPRQYGETGCVARMGSGCLGRRGVEDEGVI